MIHMIDRKSVVDRNNPVIKKIERVSPLSIGNGEFGFSTDFTGLQSFPEEYESPLSTQSNWGWHYSHAPDLYSHQDIRYQSFDTYGRQVKYPMKPDDKEEEYHWLRQNPHRLQLGRISFRFLDDQGQEVSVDDVTSIEQKLDLWTGVIHSHFLVDGHPVEVTTGCHSDHDSIGVKVVSPLIQEERLQVFILFPAPDITHNGWAKAIHPDWDNDRRHTSELASLTDQSVLIKRKMDADGYELGWHWSEGAFQQTGNHEFTLTPEKNIPSFDFAVSFAKKAPIEIAVNEIIKSSEEHWQAFWMKGGFVSFEGSTDPRAQELERRVILSQYLTAIHSGGSLPPQETGYMYNSWFGKFHLEMHWWHAAHFPLWGRADILLKSMDWYREILPKAKDIARSQGYSGVRWPNMTDFTGSQSPSAVAPGLIWQQPHPIILAEQCYKANPTDEFLNKFKEVVFESADFMVSFAHWDEDKEVFVLGPPLIPAQENHRMEESLNPPYEVEYWKFGLEIAIKWAKRLNVPVNLKWSRVARHMENPLHSNGVYLAHENAPHTFTEKNHDHPSMLGALGILPGTLIDPEVMRATLMKVKEVWDWESAWGWDFPMCAMTAARLGEREMAVDFLLMDATKNTYLPNGHNYQRPGLTAYLPGNGGLLTAIAMMTSGWEGLEDKNCPGFPDDGRWKVTWEGINDWL